MEANGTVLKTSWKGASGTISHTAFTLIWNLCSWGSLLMNQGKGMTVNGEYYHSYLEAFEAHPVALAGLFFPLVGLGMIYHTLGLWFNHTTMEITTEEFIVTRGPLYWADDAEVRIPIKDIKQAFVQEYSPFAEYDRPVFRYRLVVQRISGSETVVESEIKLLSDAQILETWLEKNLCLTNLPVSGEASLDEEISRAS